MKQFKQIPATKFPLDRFITFFGISGHYFEYAGAKRIVLHGEHIGSIHGRIIELKEGKYPRGFKTALKSIAQ